MGMHTALMQEIETGIEGIKINKGRVVEITRSGQVVSAPFALTEAGQKKEQQESAAQVNR